jgi:pyrrolidone-carboxylate peptidase
MNRSSWTAECNQLPVRNICVGGPPADIQDDVSKTAGEFVCMFVIACLCKFGVAKKILSRQARVSMYVCVCVCVCSCLCRWLKRVMQ